MPPVDRVLPSLTLLLQRYLTLSSHQRPSGCPFGLWKGLVEGLPLGSQQVQETEPGTFFMPETLAGEGARLCGGGWCRAWC